MAVKTQTELSLKGIPKPALNNILHNLLLQQVQAAKNHHNKIYIPGKRHRFTIYQYYKNYCLLSRLRGKALCLLKTQYAKKPKNPV